MKAFPFPAGAVLIAAFGLAACQDTAVTAPSSADQSLTTDGSRALTTPPAAKAGSGQGAAGAASGGLQLRYASQVANPVPSSVIVTYQGLEWVWASPCALGGCTSGILVGKDGFNFATAAQWALRPPVSNFFGKCASPWFDLSYNHCDQSNLTGGAYGSVAAGGTGQVGPLSSTMLSYYETLLVRTPVVTDATPPVITPTVTGTLGTNYWYTSDVNVSWSVVDNESAITSQTGCGSSTVNTNTAGVTFTCSATSTGGTASQSVTIKRDATLPTVTYAGNAGSYTVDQVVAITCSAADDLSGIASDTCVNIAGPAYTFGLGVYNFSATATDMAGNQGTGQGSFTVRVTFASLCNLTTSLVAKAGIANSLCAKLNAAAASASRGNANATANQIGAFVHEVEAQTGKAISPANAAILIALANALL